MTNFKERLISLDVFRGLTMACMVLVENPGNWDIYASLSHARWGMPSVDGKPVHETFTPTDLVMPFFIFIVGVSVALGFWNKRNEESIQNNKKVKLKIIRRTINLFILGIIFYAYPSVLDALLYKGKVHFEVLGVLQRIAIVYLASALIFLKWNTKTIIWIGITALFVYWILTFIPVPGYPEPQFLRQYFTPGKVPSSFPEWVDAKLIGFANPSGIVSTIPAIVTGLIGVLTGILLKTEKNKRLIVKKMIGGSALLLIAGYTWSLSFPIIKDLWTSSYTLVAGGYSLLVFAIIYWLVDVMNYKSWSTPFVVYGVNCISVYFVSHVVSTTLYGIKIGTNEDTISVHEWINNNVFETWLSPINASLMFALTNVILWLIPLWVMYKKKIFIKI